MEPSKKRWRPLLGGGSVELRRLRFFFLGRRKMPNRRLLRLGIIWQYQYTGAQKAIMELR